MKAALPEAKVIWDASCCAGTTPEKHRAALDMYENETDLEYICDYAGIPYEECEDGD